MEGSRKRICENFKDEGGMKRLKTLKSDMLSSLPDSVLVTIFAHLTAKEVFQTCLLSKRFRNIWALVPSLCFDLHDCNNDTKIFKKFVTNFLLKRDGATDIHSFRISFDRSEAIDDCLDCTPFDLIELIRYVIMHNPRKLELSYTEKCSLDIAVSLFACKTLEYLKLNLWPCSLQELKPSAVYLPRLRAMDLTHICFPKDLLENILLGCPVLEDLRLDSCALMTSSFSCHNVKRLELLDTILAEKNITIYAPFLEKILNTSSHESRIILESTSKLTHAIWYDGSGFEDEEYACHLLNSLSGVKDLEITSSSAMAMLEGGLGRFPTFENLNYLVIHELSVWCEFAAWTSLFQFFPNLEKLYFVTDGELCDVEGECMNQSLKQIQRFPFKELKTVGIIYHEYSSTVSLLASVLKEWMKETTGVELILLEETTGVEFILIEGKG